jgi:hypothetical protein
MADLLTPMTKLEAVNVCLGTIGEPAVNSLDGASLDAQMASDFIDETSRRVQSKGWHWNKETHTLSPDINNNIVLPVATVEVDTVNGSRNTDVVQRGNRLYDRENNTYEFDTALELKLVVLLPFDDLPNVAKDYITIRAARLFQARVLGSETLHKLTAQDEADAMTALKRHELRTGDYNMLTGSVSTASIVDRMVYHRSIR